MWRFMQLAFPIIATGCHRRVPLPGQKCINSDWYAHNSLLVWQVWQSCAKMKAAVHDGRVAAVTASPMCRVEF